MQGCPPVEATGRRGLKTDGHAAGGHELQAGVGEQGRGAPERCRSDRGISEVGGRKGRKCLIYRLLG